MDKAEIMAEIAEVLGTAPVVVPEDAFTIEEFAEYIGTASSTASRKLHGAFKSGELMRARKDGRLYYWKKG